MSAQNLTLAMRLLLDSQQFTSRLRQSGRDVGGWSAGVRRELTRVRSAWTGVQGKLAGIGASVGIAATVIQSAKLDKSLRQIELTAGASGGEITQLRDQLFQLAKDTGRPVDDLNQGVNNLVQSGLKLREALPVIQATSKAMAVGNTDANSLTAALSVAAASFDFDLSKPELAVRLLDKMVVAGRLGNAELESLASVFPRVIPNARAAGFSFDKTLGFVEGLSLIERQPDRLATLSESTLRLFTNARYRQAAQAATGVKFFDKEGAARDPLAVLEDLRVKYQKLTTDQQRSRFISRAFQNTDLDTQRGLRTLLSGDSLNRVKDFSTEIGNAAGTLDRDLKHAIDNSVDQVGRLKAVLGETADQFGKMLNAGISAGIKKLLDSKEEGGFGLSGKQLIGGAAAIGVGGYLLSKAPGLLGKLGGKATELATGVATGQALAAAGAATPVFVVNMPSGGIGGGDVGGILGGLGVGATAAKVFSGWRAGAALLLGANSVSSIGAFGAAGVAGAGALVAGAGAVGYGVGSLISKGIEDTAFADKIGEAVARALAFFGNAEARDAIERTEKYQASIRVELDDKRARVTKMETNNNKTELNVEQRGSILLGAD